jgi:small redox-active disulfide protein 2
MTIQILGTGCPKCRLLKKSTQEAIAHLGLDVEIAEVTDPEAMMEMGMLVSPGFAIDGKLLQMGRVLRTEQVAALIASHQKGENE